jgi:hypothetical protein
VAKVNACVEKVFRCCIHDDVQSPKELSGRNEGFFCDYYLIVLLSR